jgi:L-threonylcarbamoyladenylate synthase
MFDAALAQLRAGKVVALATESFFGLLADIESTSAIDCLLSLKPRGSDKGVPLLLPDAAGWSRLVGVVPPLAQRLGERFWPGPLSIALPALPEVDPRVALDGTVAVRVPGPSPALDLVRAFGSALTATSANLPGEPPAISDADVGLSFGAAIADGRLLVISGRSPGGRPSTIVVCRDERPLIAREGAIPADTVLAAARSA